MGESILKIWIYLLEYYQSYRQNFCFGSTGRTNEPKKIQNYWQFRTNAYKLLDRNDQDRQGSFYHACPAIAFNKNVRNYRTRQVSACTLLTCDYLFPNGTSEQYSPNEIPYNISMDIRARNIIIAIVNPELLKG